MNDRIRDHGQLRMFATLLSQPQDDALDALRDMLPTASWLRDGIAELEGTPLEHWQGEHTRLFVSGWPKTPCPPFQSAYRQGHMGGTAAIDLQDLYRRAGLQANEMPTDYLGTMLECAAWLAEQDDATDLLRELEEEHLDLWLPRFALDLRENARLTLYRDLGEQVANLYPKSPENE